MSDGCFAMYITIRDGGHSLEITLHDIMLASCVLRPGGIVVSAEQNMLPLEKAWLLGLCYVQSVVFHHDLTYCWLLGHRASTSSWCWIPSSAVSLLPTAVYFA